VIEAFGGDEEVDELIEISYANLHEEAANKTWPLRYAAIDYQPCDEDGAFKQGIEIKGELLMRVKGNDVYFEGDDRGLLSLASIFVAMAQPAMPEEGMLILDADMFAPGSFGHLELMRWSDWPRWNLKRTDEVPRAFLPTGYQLEDMS